MRWLATLVRAAGLNKDIMEPVDDSRVQPFVPEAAKPGHLANLWPLPLSPHNIAWPRTAGGDLLIDDTGRRRKVCIYGAGMGKDEAPLDDPSWEVWGLNAVPPYDAAQRLRADRWFDLHQRLAQNEADLRWIRDCPVPIYVPPDLEDGGPLTVHYPLAAIEHAFGVSYWACTFAYQIALALFEGVATDIGLYGVELAYGTNRERTVEWACTAYWIGRAMERGVRFHTPADTTLLWHPGRYGFEYLDELQSVKMYTDSMDRVDLLRKIRRSNAGMGG